MSHIYTGLTDSTFEPCQMFDRATVPDGEGGFIESWKDGAEFMAHVGFNNSLESRKAQTEGVKNVYTVTTSERVTLRFHDIFRRESDGKIFRVTSDNSDVKAPKVSAIRIRTASAEEYAL